MPRYKVTSGQISTASGLCKEGDIAEISESTFQKLNGKNGLSMEPILAESSSEVDTLISEEKELEEEPEQDLGPWYSKKLKSESYGD